MPLNELTKPIKYEIQNNQVEIKHFVKTFN